MAEEFANCWDHCISCGTRLNETPEPPEWRRCQGCETKHARWKWTYRALIAGMWAITLAPGDVTLAKLVGLAGLTMCAQAAIMLASGWLESMILAATGFGGEMRFIAPQLQKQSPKFRRALGLLATGTLLQGASLSPLLQRFDPFG